MRIDPARLSPGRRYYLMLSCIIPRPIAWVGTVNADGSHNLAPFSYFNGLSTTPPIVGLGFAPRFSASQAELRQAQSALTGRRRIAYGQSYQRTTSHPRRWRGTGANLPWCTTT